MVSVSVHMTPEQAGLVSAVLERPDAVEALEFVLAQAEGGPSCGCGADHWSCDWSAEDGEE